MDSWMLSVPKRATAFVPLPIGSLVPQELDCSLTEFPSNAMRAPTAEDPAVLCIGAITSVPYVPMHFRYLRTRKRPGSFLFTSFRQSPCQGKGDPIVEAPDGSFVLLFKKSLY